MKSWESEMKMWENNSVMKKNGLKRKKKKKKKRVVMKMKEKREIWLENRELNDEVNVVSFFNFKIVFIQLLRVLDMAEMNVCLYEDRYRRW